MLFSRKKQQAFTETGQPYAKPEKKRQKTSEIIAKLSRGLMLPIAMLPIAGLFLGIGATIFNLAGDNEGLKIFGNILKIPGDVVFGNLAVLFAIAIAITFSKDSGVAGLSAFVGWIVFCALQSALIINKSNAEIVGDYHMSFLFYNYDGAEGKSLFDSIFTNNVGIKSLSTSVFGGITIGFVVAWLYNKFKNIQLPSIIGFFSGVRFIPIVTFGASLLVSLIFGLIWPLIGWGLFSLGGILSGAPAGVNSLVFGYVERALVPFGLHHAFYTPLWYTAAGGSLNVGGEAYVKLNDVFYQVVNQAGQQISWNTFANLKPDAATAIQGDQTIWMYINANLAGQNVFLKDIATGEILAPTKLTYQMIIDGTAYSKDGISCNPGQYMQGKYPFMIFALPAAALAMVTSVAKGNRKVATSIVASAALTSFLTGITEPLEFTFLFLAPWMFWGFHAIFCGVSFWFMNLLGAHMGMTFSGGLLDFTIYGIIPDAIGAQANCYWAVIIGLVLMPIYYFGFYYFIKKFDILTPGRGGNTKLFTKQDFISKKEENSNSKSSAVRSKALNVIKAYGGLDNIVNVDACITKLRIQVANQDLVDRDQLMALGARGVIKPSKQSVYAVFGGEADRIKNEINDIINEKQVKATVNTKVNVK